MITDNELKAAALELDDALMDDLPEDEETEFSPRFERKMKRLLRRKGPSRWKGYCVRAAAVLLTVLLLGGIVVISSPETLADFKGLFYEVEGEYRYRYVLNGWVEPEDVKNYRLGWIPEGYVYEHSSIRPTGELISYKNKDNKFISFDYIIQIEGRGRSMIYHSYHSAHKLEETIVNGRGADLFVFTNKKGEKYYDVIWMNEERSILFTVSNARSEEEAVRMAESVEEWIPEETQ